MGEKGDIQEPSYVENHFLVQTSCAQAQSNRDLVPLPPSGQVKVKLLLVQVQKGLVDIDIPDYAALYNVNPFGVKYNPDTSLPHDDNRHEEQDLSHESERAGALF